MNENMKKVTWNTPDDCLPFLISEEEDDEVKKEVEKEEEKEEEPVECLWNLLNVPPLLLQLLLSPFLSLSVWHPLPILDAESIESEFDVVNFDEEKSNRVWKIKEKENK